MHRCCAFPFASEGLFLYIRCTHYVNTFTATFKLYRYRCRYRYYKRKSYLQAFQFNKSSDESFFELRGGSNGCQRSPVKLAACQLAEMKTASCLGQRVSECVDGGFARLLTSSFDAASHGGWRDADCRRVDWLAGGTALRTRTGLGL